MYNDNNQVGVNSKYLKLVFTFVVLLHWFELYLIKVVDMNEFFDGNLYFFVYLFLLSGIVYGYYKISNRNKHFLLYCVLLSVGCYINLLGNIANLPDLLLATLPLLNIIIPVVRVYYITHAFAQLLEVYDSDLKQKWLDLWKWNKYTFLIVVSSIILLFVLPNLSQLLLRLTEYISVYLIVLELWYLFTTVLYFDELSRGKVGIEARILSKKWYVKCLFGLVCFVSSFMILFNFQTITIENGEEVLIYNSPFNHKPGGSVRYALGKELDVYYGEGMMVQQPMDVWNGNEASVYDTTRYGYEYLGQDMYGGDYILCTVHTSRNVQFEEFPEYITNINRSLTYIGYDDDNIQSSAGAKVYWDTFEEEYSMENKEYFDGTALITERKAVYGVISDENEEFDFDVAVYYDVIESEDELKFNIRRLDILPRDKEINIISQSYSSILEPFYYDGVQSFLVNCDFEYKVNNITKKDGFSMVVYSRKWEGE